MNFKLDSKWRKVASDDTHTTMEHYEGHSIKIAHSKLTKPMKEKLHALPTHKSKADRDAAKAADAKEAPKNAQDARHEAPKGSMPHAPSHRQEQAGKDKGVSQPVRMAGGGEVPTPPPPQTLGKRIGYPGYAEGGEIPADALTPEAVQPAAVSGIQVQNAGPAMAANAQLGGPRALPQDTGALPYGTEGTPGAAPIPEVSQAPAPQSDIAPQGAAAPLSSAPTPGAAPGQAPDPYGTAAYQEAYMTGLGESKLGLAQEAQATEAQGLAQAKVLNDQVSQQQKRMQEYQNHYNGLETERQAAMKDYSAGHIDPNHWWSSKDTGGKIGTIIGLIAGGLSPSGQNGALTMINSQIDRDIAAQRAEMDKKNNVISHLDKQFGNLKDATDMMRVMSMDLVSNQLKAAAAKAAGPMAKAKILQAAGQLDMQAAPVLSQIAMRRTLVGGMNAGHVDPSAVVRMIVPEHQQPAAYKEIKEAQDTSSFRNNLLGSFDKLHQINTLGGRIGSPIQTPKQVAAIKDPLTAALSKGTAGRFTEQDAGMLETLWPKPGDSDETIAIKRAQMTKLSDEKMHFPVLQAYGIQPQAMTNRYDAAGQKRIQMAAPVRPK